MQQYILQQIATLQQALDHFEQKYGMRFQQFTDYLHERSRLLEKGQLTVEQRRTLGQAIMNIPGEAKGKPAGKGGKRVRQHQEKNHTNSDRYHELSGIGDAEEIEGGGHHLVLFDDTGIGDEGEKGHHRDDASRLENSGRDHG